MSDGSPTTAPEGPVPTPPPARSKPRKVFLLIGLILATALAVGLFTGVGTGRSGGIPGVGTGAPSFSLPRLGARGTVGTPADGGGGGRPAVLLFFASWCGPCHAEMPALAAEYRHEQAAGGPLARIAVIGVDGLDPVSRALPFVHQSGITFPVASDMDYDVTEGLYYFNGDPDAVFIEANGTIARIHHGAISASQLLSWERQLVKS